MIKVKVSRVEREETYEKVSSDEGIKMKMDKKISRVQGCGSRVERGQKLVQGYRDLMRKGDGTKPAKQRG